jgi:hypothetical protein
MKQDAQTIQKIEELVKKLESLAWVDEVEEYTDEPRKYVHYDELHSVQVSAMVDKVERFKQKTGINVRTYVDTSKNRGKIFTVKVY